MSDPFNHPFLQKDNTMYLSTISKQDFSASQRPFYRDSSFQQHDIPGTTPKVLIPKKGNTTNFALSTYIQPVPDRAKHLQKQSNPLYVDDIEGARPKVSQFKTKRVVDPLAPRYMLPSASEVVVDPGRKFIRDTLNTQDINNKRSHTLQNRGREVLRQPVEGSSPSKLTKDLNAVSRLDVKDINKEHKFESRRTTNPLEPNYQWRDDYDRHLNPTYGHINGAEVRQIHPSQINRPNNLNLNVKDIEGTQANSYYARSHFVDKRRQFRNYMTTQDIDKAAASTLKKGISSTRQTNPLMPNYQLPGHSEVK